MIGMGKLSPLEFPPHASTTPLVCSYRSPSFPLFPPPSSTSPLSSPYPPPSLLSSPQFPSFLPLLFSPPPSIYLLSTTCNEGFWNLLDLLDSPHLSWDLRQVTRAPYSSVVLPVKQEKRSRLTSLTLSGKTFPLG